MNLLEELVYYFAVVPRKGVFRMLWYLHRNHNVEVELLDFVKVVKIRPREVIITDLYCLFRPLEFLCLLLSHLFKINQAAISSSQRSWTTYFLDPCNLAYSAQIARAKFLS